MDEFSEVGDLDEYLHQPLAKENEYDDSGINSMALDEPDSDSEQPGKDFSEQVPLGEVTTQIAESVKDLIIPAIQDSIPIDRIEDRGFS